MVTAVSFIPSSINSILSLLIAVKNLEREIKWFVSIQVKFRHKGIEGWTKKNGSTVLIHLYFLKVSSCNSL